MIEHAPRAAAGQLALREREGRADRATLRADADHARGWAAKSGGFEPYYLALALELERTADGIPLSKTESGSSGSHSKISKFQTSNPA